MIGWLYHVMTKACQWHATGQKENFEEILFQAFSCELGQAAMILLIGWPLYHYCILGAGDIKLLSVVSGIYGLYFSFCLFVLFVFTAGIFALFYLLCLLGSKRIRQSVRIESPNMCMTVRVFSSWKQMKLPLAPCLTIAYLLLRTDIVALF